MGIYDKLDEEFLREQEEIAKKPKQTTFQKKHPFLSSLPEAGKQFGIRAVKSVPQFLSGLGDSLALTGDMTNWNGLSNYGRNAAGFYQKAADKIQIDPRYQGAKGFTKLETFVPTALGYVGDNATNIATTLLGIKGATTGLKALGLTGKGLKAAGYLGAATPNLVQEGEYLEKKEQFKKIYGREPNSTELKNIQNVALGEKGVNAALEGLSDLSLFGKFLPNGTAKGLKKLGQDMFKQTITEAGTEGLQESVSIGAEKLLGINKESGLDNFKRAGEAAIIGGVTGGILGGAFSGIGTIADRIQQTAPNTYAKQNIQMPANEDYPAAGI